MIISSWLVVVIIHTLTSIDWLATMIHPHLTFKRSLYIYMCVYSSIYIVYQWGWGKHLIINLDVFEPKYNALLELHNMKLSLDL
jgi:hypothetical protein